MDISITGVPLGNPAGIGPEIIIDAILSSKNSYILPIGNAMVLDRLKQKTGLNFDIIKVTAPENIVNTFHNHADSENIVPIFDIEDGLDTIKFGKRDPKYAQSSIKYIERGLDLLDKDYLDSIALGPHSKSLMLASQGRELSDILNDRINSNNGDFSIMLVSDNICVGHVTTHIPLRDVYSQIDSGKVYQAILNTYTNLKKIGLNEPSIAVAGLNPHASDNGAIGSIEAEEIRPGINKAKKNNINVSGPHSPDTVFSRAINGEFSCILAMYHDQGHIPFKTAVFKNEKFGGAAILTGIPINCVVPNHGPAFNIAGENEASSNSMKNSINYASLLAK